MLQISGGAHNAPVTCLEYTQCSRCLLGAYTMLWSYLGAHSMLQSRVWSTQNALGEHAQCSSLILESPKCSSLVLGACTMLQRLIGVHRMLQSGTWSLHNAPCVCWSLHNAPKWLVEFSTMLQSGGVSKMLHMDGCMCVCQSVVDNAPSQCIIIILYRIN